MSNGGKMAWGLVGLLTILHFDFWLWDDTTLLFGFMPLGLAFQAGISLGAAIAWVLVTRFDWPHGVEAWAEQGSSATESKEVK